MESIFSRDPAPRAPSIFDQIGPEIEHLQNGQSVREGLAAKSKTGAWIASIAICLLLVLFFMDPFLYAMQKSEAIRAYVYLHNYASNSSTQELAKSGIFTRDEILTMNARQGSYQNYFSSPQEAEEQAASVVGFMQGLRDLRSGQYSQLDPIAKLRYLLFIRIGLYPPTVWSGLSPSVN